MEMVHVAGARVGPYDQQDMNTERGMEMLFLPFENEQKILIVTGVKLDLYRWAPGWQINVYHFGNIDLYFGATGKWTLMIPDQEIGYSGKLVTLQVARSRP